MMKSKLAQSERFAYSYDFLKYDTKEIQEYNFFKEEGV